jgi:hypothetical protein
MKGILEKQDQQWYSGTCRMLNYSTKACGGILPNHCYKPFLFVFGLTI